MSHGSDATAFNPHAPSDTLPGSGSNQQTWQMSLAVLFMICSVHGIARADSIAFDNLAADPAMNLHFERAWSRSRADLQALYDLSVVEPMPIEAVFAQSPHRTGGFPGVALIDHDTDGDIDIYVTNGPGAANALFENQLHDTGELGFVNIGENSGADATDQDSNGVCFGDLDNDGDDDLYVLGREEHNRLYENNDGHFREVTAHGAEGGSLSHISCSMGDIDGDGLLDIAVANSFDLSSALALVGEPYALNHQNQLFRNEGDLRFQDHSTASGILDMQLGGTTDPQPPTISWAVSMVDIDQDGDIDILFGDDQAGLPNAARGGFDRGYLQVFLNDGTGHFSNSPVVPNENSAAAWMGLGFGDADCNGTIDVFGSNLGSYMFEANGMPSNLQAEATRWVLGNGDGTFNDPGVSAASVFGWGNAVADLDNDGDQDVLYHGAMDLNAIITHDNPGVVLENQGCTATFVENLNAFRGDYTTRGTQGVAVGDLDRDGFMDVVTVSNHRVTELMPFFISPAQYGSDLDAMARFYLPMPLDPVTGLVSWGGIDTQPGTLTVERNTSSKNGTNENRDGVATRGYDPSTNRAASFKLIGSVGLVYGAQANRSGIGAVVSFTPKGMPRVTQPLVAGSSFTSQHALDVHFGFGRARTGTVEVQWPGGTRNRLYHVRADEHLVLPEIPCSIDSDVNQRSYSYCVRQALRELRFAGVISRHESVRLRRSAMRAFRHEMVIH